MADPKGPGLVIAIGRPKPGDAPQGDDQGYGDQDALAEGQEIVDKVRALPPEELQKLFAGIDPGALEAMGQVDCLAPLADFLQNGGKDDGASASPPVAPPSNLRDQVAGAVRKTMPPAA